MMKNRKVLSYDRAVWCKIPIALNRGTNECNCFHFKYLQQESYVPHGMFYACLIFPFGFVMILSNTCNVRDRQ